jgi:hypothetical protein
VFLSDNLVSWSSKRQDVVSSSSAEAEYRIVANGVAEACLFHQLLVELHNPLSQATLVYCDNVSAVYLSTNSIQHQRTKHVEIDFHFVYERIAIRDDCVLHVSMTSQFVDIFTKGLPPRCSQSFSPVSTSAVARVLTAGGVRELIVLGAWAACVRRFGPFVWGEAQPLAYNYVHLSLNLIEQPLLPL